ncbi:archaetidylserine decarboxylase [Thermoflavimicrobium daqui]|jgi:phosphatidylserine decarboxylase|uniref:Phosphatidylserine decarboxylase proenzyme n=1 Tax=Thermoflavimicrobium daqui TaxID=2137476 RepID=A0A364K5Z9_9BACL|nr:archaetidylserine decarboxylase [Thermoflavimicrobium daqui]RAL25724.1 phosphatidylserine decarboxylase [Thermoflavimicrobium daqui]
MKEKFQYFFWKGLPKRALSRLIGTFAQTRLSRRMIPFYIKHFQIDLSPVKKPVDQFENLLDFFIREYRPEARPIDLNADIVVSPVDGVVRQIGDIHQGLLLQAKGISYSLHRLLAENDQKTHKFTGGKFVTIYLSPRDYHRIHMPFEGVIKELAYIPGDLYPVNDLGTKLFPGLLALNERVISYIQTELGEIALIKVGATNVGSIKVSFDEQIVTNPRSKKGLEHKVYEQAHQLAKGEEMGRFEFGSTVILLFEPNQIDWLIEAKEGTQVQMGQPLARMIK